MLDYLVSSIQMVLPSEIPFSNATQKPDTVVIWNPDYAGFKMGSEIQKTNCLKSGQMAVILTKTIQNQDKNVWILYGWDHSYSPSLWKPDQLKSDLQNLDFLCFRIFEW